MLRRANTRGRSTLVRLLRGPRQCTGDASDQDDSRFAGAMIVGEYERSRQFYDTLHPKLLLRLAPSPPITHVCSGLPAQLVE